MKIINAAIDKGAKFILTSRDYIFKSAQSSLKTSACPVFDDSQVHVLVEKIQPHEKEQILYNHLKFGNQSKSFRARIKPFLSEIAKRQGFMPELARRLGDKTFTKALKIDNSSFSLSVGESIPLLKEMSNLLDDHSTSLIKASLNRFIDEPMLF